MGTKFWYAVTPRLEFMLLIISRSTSFELPVNLKVQAVEVAGNEHDDE
jgi:hypothetical protein